MDSVDEANALVIAEQETAIKKARSVAACIPEGRAGVCADCCQHSRRLVDDLCAPCRDERIGLT